LLWCLVFVQKSDFQEKYRKILQKFYFARRPTEPEGETKGACAHLWGGCLGRRLDPSFRLHIPSELKTAGVRRFSQIDFRYAAAIRNRDSEPETPFWHPAGMGIWRRSSSPSSPTSLHQPSKTPPSMCE
jgi:hypothetical protein